MRGEWAIPESWRWTRLGEVTRVVGGGTPKTGEPDYWNGDVPWLTPADLSGYVRKTIGHGARSITASGLARSAARLLPTGTVLFSSRAPIGYVAIAANPIATNQGFKSFVPPAEVSSSFLFHYLRSAKAIAIRSASGTTFKELSKKRAALLPFPLAPLSEQHRIVTKIESLFAKLDEGVAALKRAEANLERYRASVLKAAVEGRLTEQWRRENPPEETGEELLGRILIERRKRWEAEQLAKFAAKGRKPPRNWKVKYKEPVAPDTGKLPELPEGWCWATVDQVALGMRNGRSVRTRAGGFPVLRLSAITGAVLDDRDIKEGDWGPKKAEPFRVRQGDFFVSRGNGSLDLVGRASFADRAGDVAFPDTMIRVTFACRRLVRARFVAAIWNSQCIRRQITACAKTSAGIFKINQLDLRGVLVPVPPIAEQDLITGSHRKLESARSSLANRIAAWRQHTSRLRQSILKRAFEGGLVPQDPADEPASVLLERIRAERAAKPKRSKRRSPKPRRQRRSSSRPGA